MIADRRHLTMLIWAAREIQRRPGRTFLLFSALASLVVIVAAALLFSQALQTTWSRLMAQTPDLVVRRIDAGGWAPLPVAPAMADAARVPGILNPTPRLWGIATAGNLPVTVVTASASLPDGGPDATPRPETGQVVVGPALLPAIVDGHLTLSGRETLTVAVIGTLPDNTDLATADLVWLAPADARRLLGIPAGYASDLALYLFHHAEADALKAELADAFPWPVRITDREDRALARHTRAARIGALAMVVSIPALLALLLIVAGTITNGRADHQGLLRTLGWSTGDLVRLQVLGDLIVGVPAVAIGLTAAYVLVFWPPAAGITALWITGGQHLPTLVLSRDGALLVMLEISAMTGLPYLAAVFLTTLRGAAGDIRPLSQVDPWN